MEATPRGRTATLSSVARRLFPAAVALLPLACWPAASRPFSAPKLWVIAALDLLIVFQGLSPSPTKRPGASQGVARPSWPWLAWIAAVSLSAITAPYLSPGAFLLIVLPLPLVVWGVDAESTLRALCVASAIESAIVLLQCSGHDPFGWIGWVPETFSSPRMRMYGTLGNPDFVATWLSATLPLCAVMPRRAERAALATLQLAAIFCTGSRVLVLVLPAAMLAFAVASRRFEKWWLLAVPVACAVVWFSPARPLRATVEGRLRLASVTSSHLAEVPVTGYGPGAFEARFTVSQQAPTRDGEVDRQIAGPVDHAHDDYLEFWVEYGPLGFAAFLTVCGSLAWRAWRRRVPGAVAAALGALLAVALVDFPFHRPAAWTLFAILAGVNKEA